MPDKTSFNLVTTRSGFLNPRNLRALKAELKRLRIWARWVTKSIKNGGPVGGAGQPKYP